MIGFVWAESHNKEKNTCFQIGGAQRGHGLQLCPPASRCPPRPAQLCTCIRWRCCVCPSPPSRSPLVAKNTSCPAGISWVLWDLYRRERLLQWARLLLVDGSEVSADPTADVLHRRNYLLRGEQHRGRKCETWSRKIWIWKKRLHTQGEQSGLLWWIELICLFYWCYPPMFSVCFPLFLYSECFSFFLWSNLLLVFEICTCKEKYVHIVRT